MDVLNRCRRLEVYSRGGGTLLPVRLWSWQNATRLLFLVPIFITQVILGQGTLPLNRELSLQDYLQEVWKANELLQVRALEAAITDEQLEAEKAIFDPVFVGQFDALDQRRPNTSEQMANLGFSKVFNQRNRIIQSGVEVLTPVGARLEAGYNLSELNNNLNSGLFPNGEYLSNVEIKITQPLLKGAGRSVTMAGIRAAAINSDIGFQDYRKGMMEILGRAEIAYWDLYEAQEQYRITGESLRMANELLKDSTTRLQLGKGAELDVMQAEAGVALRDATRFEASRRLVSARSQIMIFLGQKGEGADVVTADAPSYGAQKSQFLGLWGKAFDSNPDFVSLRKRAELDGLRVVVARNAKLPQIDLTGGYGFSGIGDRMDSSFHAAEDQDFPSWSVGLQLRIPFVGDQKARHEFKAAELQKKATELGLSNFAKELENSLRTSIHTVDTYRQNGERYRKVIEFNEKVLDTQLASHEAGKSNSRDLLEAEEDLYEVRITGLANAIRYQRASLELELLSGVLLSNRRLDLSRAELRRRTAILKRNDDITKERYAEFLRRAEEEYRGRIDRPKKAPTDFNTPVEPGWEKWQGTKVWERMDDPRVEWPYTRPSKPEREDPDARKRPPRSRRKSLWDKLGN